MIRCLSERQLWELYEGGGDAAERAPRVHLDSCDVCQWHYQHLVRDLELIGRVLQEPAPQTVPVRPRQTHAWAPVVAALAATGLIVWGAAQVWEPLKMAWTGWSSYDEQTVEIAQIMEQGLMPALFSTTETGFGSLPEQATDLDYLQAALDGNWPCERSGQACGTAPFWLRAEPAGQAGQEGQDGQES